MNQNQPELEWGEIENDEIDEQFQKENRGIELELETSNSEAKKKSKKSGGNGRIRKI